MHPSPIASDKEPIFLTHILCRTWKELEREFVANSWNGKNFYNVSRFFDKTRTDRCLAQDTLQVFALARLADVKVHGEGILTNLESATTGTAGGVRKAPKKGPLVNITLLIPHGAVAIDEFLGRQFASRLLA